MSEKFSGNRLQMHKIKYHLTNLVMIILFTTVEVWSQMPSVPVPSPSEAEAESSSEFWWFYPALFVLTLGLAGAVFWWFGKKKAEKKKKT